VTKTRRTTSHSLGLVQLRWAAKMAHAALRTENLICRPSQCVDCKTFACYTGPMLTLALATMLGHFQQDSDVYPFPGTESPSKRFVVRHLAGDANELFDQKTKRSVGKLVGFSGFEGENHGGMSAAYSAKETWVAVIQMGKWEPQNLAILNTSTGRQLGMLKRIQKDAAAYLNRVIRVKDSAKYVFDVPGAKWSGSQVSFAIAGEIPKAEEAPAVNLSITYTVTASKSGIALGKAKVALMKNGQVWRWKSAN